MVASCTLKRTALWPKRSPPDTRLLSLGLSLLAQVAPMDDEAARFADNSVLRGERELGVAEVSGTLYENVTQYHAQVRDHISREEHLLLSQ